MDQLIRLARNAAARRGGIDRSNRSFTFPTKESGVDHTECSSAEPIDEPRKKEMRTLATDQGTDPISSMEPSHNLSPITKLPTRAATEALERTYKDPTSGFVSHWRIVSQSEYLDPVTSQRRPILGMHIRSDKNTMESELAASRMGLLSL